MTDLEFRESVATLAMADLPDAEIAQQLDVGVQVVRETIESLAAERLKVSANRRINPLLRL